MLVLVDSNGTKIKHFAVGQKYESLIKTLRVNRLQFETDNDDNIYITWTYLNRIEKYNNIGELLYTISRPLNYPIIHEEVLRKYESNGRIREYPDVDLSYVSYFLDIDSKGRLWVQTFNRQPEDKGSTGSSINEEGIFDFEIFSEEGILLTRVPSPQRFYKFRIYNDLLYLIDPYHEMCVYIYKIIEK